MANSHLSLEREGADSDMGHGSTLFELFFSGAYDLFEHRKAALETIVVSLMLAFASCARAPLTPSFAQTQAAQYSAASTPSPVLQASPLIASKPGYLELSVYVANQAGIPIVGLKQSDFIADASGESLPISFFSERPRAPMSLGILVDESGSMELKLDTVRLMLTQFIKDLNPSDEVFLIAFATKPQLLEPLTTDHNAVAQSLSQLHAWGKTSIYDSIVLAVAEFGKGHYPWKAILLITDGMDNDSTTKVQDAIASLRATGVKFYTIGIGDPSVPATGIGILLGPFIADRRAESVDAKALQDMARNTGGEVFIVSTIEKDAGKSLGNAVKTISGMLNDSYTVGLVVPPGTSASLLHLSVANHPDAVVTTRIINSPPT
jgi:VWFA-related protein